MVERLEVGAAPRLGAFLLPPPLRLVVCLLVEAYDNYKQARLAETLLSLCKDDKDNKKHITAILKNTGNKTRDKSAAELSRDLAYFVYNTDESSDSESSSSDSDSD